MMPKKVPHSRRGDGHKAVLNGLILQEYNSEGRGKKVCPFLCPLSIAKDRKW
jgi:hypothetical protein